MSTAVVTRRSELDPLALGLLLACGLTWGLSQVAMKIALADLGPWTQAGLRSAGAVVLLLLFAAWRGVPMWQRDGTLWPGTAAGLLFGIEFGCMFAGLQYTGASRMVVLAYLAPFVVAVGMPFIAPGERLGRWQWGGLALAFSGVVIALSEGLFGPSRGGERQWFGDLLGIATAVIWGATTLLVRATKLSTAAPEKTLAYQLGVSALLLLGGAALAGEPWGQRWTGLTQASMAFQIVAVSFASYLAWFWLVRHYPAARISGFTLVTPIAGLLFGVVLLGEPLPPSLLIGAAAVVLGMIALGRRDPAPPIHGDKPT
jgi:drug/metabolite transporter (DMT)-like permease